jgi:hypothetical protein
VDGRGKGLAFGHVDISEHGGVVDDKRGAGGCLGDDPLQVLEEVTTVDGRRLPTCGCNCGSQTFRPVGFARPHQAQQPGHIVWVVHVERVEVDPCPPCDLKGFLRQGYPPARSARQRGCSRVRPRQPMAVVVVGVDVGQEREPRCRTYLYEAKGGVSKASAGSRTAQRAASLV